MYFHAECPGKIRPVTNQPGHYIIGIGKVPENSYIVFVEAVIREIPKCLVPCVETEPHILISFPGTKLPAFVLVYAYDNVWLPPREPNGNQNVVQISSDIFNSNTSNTSLVMRLENHQQKPVVMMNWEVKGCLHTNNIPIPY